MSIISLYAKKSKLCSLNYNTPFVIADANMEDPYILTSYNASQAYHLVCIRYSDSKVVELDEATQVIRCKSVSKEVTERFKSVEEVMENKIKNAALKEIIDHLKTEGISREIDVKDDMSVVVEFDLNHHQVSVSAENELYQIENVLESLRSIRKNRIEEEEKIKRLTAWWGSLSESDRKNFMEIKDRPYIMRLV